MKNNIRESNAMACDEMPENEMKKKNKKHVPHEAIDLGEQRKHKVSSPMFYKTYTRYDIIVEGKQTGI